MKKELLVGENKINYYEYGSSNKEKIVFLHGFAFSPRHYSFLKELGKKFHVIAPLMYGINYLKEQPGNLKEYADLTKSFLNKLGIKPDYVIGHSMGGAISYLIAKNYSVKKLILLNPVLPNSHNVFQFIFHAFRKNYRNIANNHLVKDKNYFRPLYWRFIKGILLKPLKTIKLIKDIREFSYNKIYSKKTILFFGTEDEFFKLYKSDLKKFKNLKVSLFYNYNHDWPIIASKKVKEVVLKTITSPKPF